MNQSMGLWAMGYALRLALARALGKRLPGATDLPFKQLLDPFRVGDGSSKFSLNVIPLVLCRLGFYITAEDWDQIANKLHELAPGASSSTSSSDLSERTESDSQASSWSIVPSVPSPEPEVLCEMIPLSTWDGLTTKQILRQCNAGVDPEHFAGLTVREQLRHISLRDAAITRLRQELVQARSGKGSLVCK